MLLNKHPQYATIQSTKNIVQESTSQEVQTYPVETWKNWKNFMGFMHIYKWLVKTRLTSQKQN